MANICQSRFRSTVRDHKPLQNSIANGRLLYRGVQPDQQCVAFAGPGKGILPSGGHCANVKVGTKIRQMMPKWTQLKGKAGSRTRRQQKPISLVLLRIAKKPHFAVRSEGATSKNTVGRAKFAPGNSSVRALSEREWGKGGTLCPISNWARMK